MLSSVSSQPGGSAPEPAAPRWWSAFADDSRWCGVFQGGGAKGIAYVGPLREMARQKQWFSSAAGSSAGAITASLVAAGFHPDELAGMTADMLRTVGPETTTDSILHSVKPLRPLTRYSLDRLECAVEERLRVAVDRHGGDGSRTVTFSDLTQATGIGLYVLALDASLGRPVPFCAERTPDLSVAAAVAASCSIPLVFAPRYVQVDGAAYADSLPSFRRLVDGGAWANFPAFVFNDGPFRQYFGLAAMPVDAKVMGFVFQAKQPPPFPARPVRFTEDPYGHLDWYGAKLFLRDPYRDASSAVVEPSDADEEAATDEDGFLERLKWRMGLARQAAPAIFGFSVAVGLLGTLAAILVTAVSAQHWGVAALGAISLVLASLAVFVAQRLVKSVTREGADTFRSLIGLATAPPIWAAMDQKTPIVWVPPGGIDTTDFRLTDDAIRRTVEAAEEACRDQIAQAVKGETFYSVNRKTIAEMDLPKPDLTPLEELVPTRVPPSPAG